MSSDLTARYHAQLDLIARATAHLDAGRSPDLPHALIAVAHAEAPAGSPVPQADELLELYTLAYGTDADIPGLLLEGRSVCQRGKTPLELLQAGEWPLLRACVGNLAGGCCA